MRDYDPNRGVFDQRFDGPGADIPEDIERPSEGMGIPPSIRRHIFSELKLGFLDHIHRFTGRYGYRLMAVVFVAMVAYFFGKPGPWRLLWTLAAFTGIFALANTAILEFCNHHGHGEDELDYIAGLRGWLATLIFPWRWTAEHTAVGRRYFHAELAKSSHIKPPALQQLIANLVMARRSFFLVLADLPPRLLKAYALCVSVIVLVVFELPGFHHSSYAAVLMLLAMLVVSLGSLRNSAASRQLLLNGVPNIYRYFWSYRARSVLAAPLLIICVWSLGPQLNFGPSYVFLDEESLMEKYRRAVITTHLETPYIAPERNLSYDFKGLYKPVDWFAESVSRAWVNLHLLSVSTEPLPVLNSTQSWMRNLRSYVDRNPAAAPTLLVADWRNISRYELLILVVDVAFTLFLFELLFCLLLLTVYAPVLHAYMELDYHERAASQAQNPEE